MAMVNNSLAAPANPIPSPMAAMAPVPAPILAGSPVPVPPAIVAPVSVPGPITGGPPVPGVPTASATPPPQSAVRPVIRVPIDVEIARQDAYRACNPDIERPFSSFEDACHRLLPFHVLADYDADDVNDKFLDSTGRVLSRSQLWNESLTAKIIEFKSTFQKQIDAFNALCKKRADGEIRAEEGLMLEQILFHDERKKVVEMKMEMERERAETIANAERARVEQARLHEAAMLRQVQAQAQAHQAQAQAQAIHSGRIASQTASGVYLFSESNRASNASGAQVQEEENATLRAGSPEQEGAVADMLNGWDEDANNNINFLAPHSASEAGSLDLNSLTSTR